MRLRMSLSEYCEYVIAPELSPPQRRRGSGEENPLNVMSAGAGLLEFAPTLTSHSGFL